MVYKIVVIFILHFLLVGCKSEESAEVKNTSFTKSSALSEKGVFRIFSDEFSTGGVIPPDCACEWLGGKNRVPELRWSNPPPEVGGFALFMEDETNKKGEKSSVHWSVFNLPTSHTTIDNPPKYQSFGGSEGLNYRGKTGYAGPCPPRRHIYSFTILALKKNMPLIAQGEDMSSSSFRDEFGSYIIDSSTITGTYEPSQFRLLINKVRSMVYEILN